MSDFSDLKNNNNKPFHEQIRYFATILAYYMEYSVCFHLLCQLCFPILFFTNSSLMDSQFFFSVLYFFSPTFWTLKDMVWCHSLPTQILLTIQVQILYPMVRISVSQKSFLSRPSWCFSISRTLSTFLLQHCVYQRV